MGRKRVHRRTEARPIETLQAADRIPPERTLLHDERLTAVTDLLVRAGARSVLDVGCGRGALLRRLVQVPQFTRIVGIDNSIEALVQIEESLTPDILESDRVKLMHQRFDCSTPELEGFDAAAMIETIEHVEPGRLSVVERVVFEEWRPEVVVLTTPNGDYNPLLGLAEGERRHPDHHFEWGQSKFRSWSAGVARRNGFHVRCSGLGPPHPVRGSPTHLAVFQRRELVPVGGLGA